MSASANTTLLPARIVTLAPAVNVGPRTFSIVTKATLPRVLNQVDLAVINTNYAIEAKLNPLKDSLFIEDASSPYANLLVARVDNADSPAIRKLAAALNSPEVKQFLADKYQGAVVPAF